MKFLNKKAKQLITDMVISTKPKMKVLSGVCRYNFRCHYNSVHEALNNGDEKIAMCFYFQKNGKPIIHYVNIDAAGNYIDNTIGRWSETYDYYFIRDIKKKDFFKIDNIFAAYRKELRKSLPFLVRILSDIEF